MTDASALEPIISLRRQYIEPVAAMQHMPLVDEAVLTAKPLVLLLGNHSSGKSSFINHLLDREVQRTGVAPTDDGFTVLLHNDEERSIDGNALVSNPQLPFTEIEQFGPALVQHLQGRALGAELLRHVSLIDSPGMIDSAGADSQRPYDFAAAVRWFADKADLILLFFDPEKPGTTGETIQILTEALAGIDHKLRIVMNKMDLFDGMRDFARTYGALCWNLSRSLQTKDMPHIYTTVLPGRVREECRLPLDGFAAALLELEAYIAELPDRRVDSVLTQVIDEGRLAYVRGRVTELARSDVRRWRIRSFLIGGLLTAIAAIWAYFWCRDAENWSRYLEAAMPVLILGLASLWVPKWLGAWRERRARERLDDFYRACFRDELNSRDHAEMLNHDWQRVRQALARTLATRGFAGMPRLSSGRLDKLRRCVQQELPRLRKL